MEIKGKLKDLFGIPGKLIPKLRENIHDTYSNIPPGKNLTTDTIHNIAINLFINDYYPIISKNIKTDKYNKAVIMGGVAFNRNVPAKIPFLKMDTDDIDIKIYTTAINYLEKEQNALAKALSVFRFTTIIQSMYLKQVLEFLKTNILAQTNFSRTHSSIINTKKSKTSKTSKTKNITMKKTSKAKAKAKGYLKDYKIIFQIKKKNDDLKIYEIIQTIELTETSYTDLYNIIMSNIDDADLLATFKIGYNMSGFKNKYRYITFSDCKIIYPSIENPAFYSYYFLNNRKNENMTLEKLLKLSIPVDNILNLKSCGNNCTYLSINSLLVDIALMLSYVDLLPYENLKANDEKKVFLIPIGYIFKYYKYFIKFTRLFVLRKYYEGTLKGGNFINAVRNLNMYVLNNLRVNTSNLGEYDDKTIEYKKLINDFHQGFFYNKTISDNYPELSEIVDEYHILVHYINVSRSLFKQVDDKSGSVGQTIQSITIQMADKELSKYSKTFSKSLQHSVEKSKRKSQTKTQTKNY